MGTAISLESKDIGNFLSQSDFGTITTSTILTESYGWAGTNTKSFGIAATVSQPYSESSWVLQPVLAIPAATSGASATDISCSPLPTFTQTAVTTTISCPVANTQILPGRATIRFYVVKALGTSTLSEMGTSFAFSVASTATATLNMEYFTTITVTQTRVTSTATTTSYTGTKTAYTYSYGTPAEHTTTVTPSCTSIASPSTSLTTTMSTPTTSLTSSSSSTSASSTTTSPSTSSTSSFTSSNSSATPTGCVVVSSPRLTTRTAYVASCCDGATPNASTTHSTTLAKIKRQAGTDAYGPPDSTYNSKNPAPTTYKFSTAGTSTSYETVVVRGGTTETVETDRTTYVTVVASVSPTYVTVTGTCPPGQTTAPSAKKAFKLWT